MSIGTKRMSCMALLSGVLLASGALAQTGAAPTTEMGAEQVGGGTMGGGTTTSMPSGPQGMPGGEPGATQPMAPQPSTSGTGTYDTDDMYRGAPMGTTAPVGTPAPMGTSGGTMYREEMRNEPSSSYSTGKGTTTHHKATKHPKHKTTKRPSGEGSSTYERGYDPNYDPNVRAPADSGGMNE